jgi:hypothetical protein
MRMAAFLYPARPLTRSLLAIAFFVPQTYFLPTFPYAFLALGAIWLASVRRMTYPTLFVGLCVLAATVPLMLLSDRWASYLYLLSSLALVPLATTVVRNQPLALMAATRLYLMVSLLAMSLGAVALAAGVQTGIVFEDVTGVIRARGLNEEPNIMGFSLTVIYTLVLFHDRRRKEALIVLGIWCLAFASFSVYAIGSLFVISIIYIFWTRKFVLLAWIFVLLMPIALLNIERIDAILLGVDNSANFRTWGSIWVAYEAFKDCGLMGCGIGSSRSVLQGNPLMERFSAFDVLPNLSASALVEIGPFGVIVIFSMIFAVAFGNPLRRNVNRGLSFAAFYCLLSYALSGSYLYDPHFWASLGLFAVVCRSWTIYPRQREVRTSNPASLGSVTLQQTNQSGY